MDFFTIFPLILTAASCVIVMMSIKIIPEGQFYTVKRWGVATRTLKPGLHFIIPVLDRVVKEN